MYRRIPKYPPSRLETLLVPADLEMTTAALLTHIEDYGGLPRLRPIKLPSSQIRKCDLVLDVDVSWDSDGRLERIESIRLGTVRMTGRPG